MTSTKILPVNKPRREVVYKELKKQILSGRLLPGSRLIEYTLAQEMQVSRTILREVLKQLEIEGLVKIIPYRGAEVSRFSLADIEEIYEIQATLEGLAAGLAVKRMNRRDFQKLRKLQEMLRQGVTKTPEEWQKINVDFHQFFITRSGNQRLQNLIRNQRDYFARYWRIILTIPGQREKNTAAHEEILRAVEKGDSWQVRLAMEEHILQAAQSLKQFLTANSFLL